MKPDWDEIQRDYESSDTSYQGLATKYGVSKTTLLRRAQKWNGLNRTAKNGPTHDEQIFPVLRAVLPSPANAVEGANLGLEALVAYLKVNKREMDLADHVKASNALAQYNKIIINAPPEEQEEEEEDLSVFDDDELRLYAELQERAKKRA